MKIGVILTGFDMDEYVAPCLEAWCKARADKLGGHEYVICAVAVPFVGFPSSGGEDNTVQLLLDLKEGGGIDHLIREPCNIPESTARGMAMHWLVQQHDVTHVWQVDLDEVYTTTDISRITDFVAADLWSAWWRISFKNLVFTEDQYLAEPFTPPRIFSTRVGGYRVHSFSGDNDIQYGGTITRDIKPQGAFPSLTIPMGVAHVKHFSWLSNERSRKKIAYQTVRWGNVCQFAWDPVKGLIFNPALPAPKVIHEAD